MRFIQRLFFVLSLFFIFCLISSFFTSKSYAQAKRIYIGNDDHTDYMWTANESTYRAAFSEMIKYYLDQADSTNTNASDFQGRFNADGNFWMWVYEKDKPADFQRLINRIKDGHITIPLNTLAMIFGGQNAEAVIRGMYYPGRIERKYNFRFPLALAMENQTLPFGVGTLWAGAGAKYSWRGICNCASQISPTNRDKEIYWWTGLDGSKILMKWNSMIGGYGNMGIGGYAEARYTPETVEYVSTSSEFQAKYPYNVIGAFGKGWDDLKTLTNEFITVAQQKSNSARKVIVSNEADFFQDFENTYGGTISSASVSYGNEWDLFSASAQEYSSRVKRAVEKLRSAEAMATLVSLNNPAFMDSYSATRDQAFVNLSLFWEHCGGSGGGVGESARFSWMKGLVTSFEGYVNTLYNDSLTALASQIQKTGTNTRFFVFNPLSWTRTDVADIAYSGSIPVKVLDLTNNSQEVPSQIIAKTGTQYIRILASNIPSVGYRVYEIQSGAGQTFPQPVTVSGSNTIIENNYYKLTISPGGAITSLIDKTRSNREFGKTISSKVINDLGSGTNGILTVENSGPVSITILATSSSPVSHTSRITLFNGIDRIDIQNNITQNFTSTLSWANGFNLTSPDVNYEEVGAVMKAKLASAGGQYANSNARYDYLTLNHFADMTGTEGVGITLSNQDVNFMKLGNSTVTSLDTTTSQFSPIAGGQLGSGEDYSAGQGGITSFLQRFALQTHDAYSPTNAMRFSLEHQNPLITTNITGGNYFPAASYSFLTISDPNVLLWALKPAEEGIDDPNFGGIITRLWNMANTDKSFSLSLPNHNITSAKQTTHLETNLDIETILNQALSSSIFKNQMKTFRLLTSASIITPSPTPTNGSVSPTPTQIPPSPTPTPSCILGPYGDTDCNNSINTVDFNDIISHFGSSDSKADLDGSGKVNLLDLSILLHNFGRTQ